MRGRTPGALLLLGTALAAAYVWPAERLGDFDGDGRADVLLQHADGSWRYHGSLTSGSQGHPVRLTRKSEWYWAAVGDFNGDRSDDALMRRSDGVWVYYPMDGRRVLADESGWANLPRDTAWRIAGVGDFDADGRDDVLLRHVEGNWRLYPMDGRRMVRNHTANLRFVGDVAWRFVAVGDFDADGQDDILLRHTSGRWRWQTSTGDAVTSRRPSLPGDWRWRLAGVGDLDGDGSDDVLLRHVDGRWRTHSGLAGAAVAGTPDLPRGLAWQIAAPPVHIPDPALRRSVRFALALSAEAPITRRALSGLEALEANAVGVSDLSGLGLATGLRDLELRAVSSAHGTPKSVVDDITELSSLVQLARLSLTNHGFTDISPLSTLTRLERLNLTSNRIGDIGPLARLGRLHTLWMNHNRVADLSPLASLEHLHTLSLDDNDLVDISPLSGLDSRRSLYLSWNGIEDATPLTPLRHLTVLRMYSNRIADISPLAPLTKLQVLSLSRNSIGDASAVSAMTDLWFLGLSENHVTDISPLEKLTNMRWLWLQENSISDVTPLSGMVGLTRLHLESNAIVDITPLAEFTKLKMLTLDDNGITDLTALTNLTALTDVGLARNRIGDISALRNLREVERLNLSGNEIVDTGALELLTELGELDLSYNRIVDVSWLIDLHALKILRLAHNAIVDIGAVSGLTALEDLDLSYNNIVDLSPLVDNEGLGAGDRVDVRGNPLTDASFETAVPVLLGRGVVVEAGARPRLEAVHDDSVVVLHVEEDIAALDLFTGLPLDAYTSALYAHFEDAFDFVMFFSNLDDIRDHEHSHYYGVYSSVRNDTEGSGMRTFYDNRYGSAERLKGVIHFPYNRALLYGPALHEMLHAWANYTIPTAVGGHWGFSSADGQLGGFDIADLVELGDGRYAAGRFGTFANGGNGPPYSPIELYFAGYLTPDEVPDLWVAADGEWVVEDGSLARTEDGSGIFAAADVRTYTIKDIVAEHGIRVPSMADAQWHFRVAVVLLTDDDHPATDEQLGILSDHVAAFSLRGDDGRHQHNFYEATVGRGSVAMEGLSQFRKTVPEAVDNLPVSYGVVPPPYASMADGRCVQLRIFHPGLRWTTGVNP
ncbi:MAG: hypothetical protein OXH15_20815 [Gammaproteobacteria bacterium]|nr:hypothetical protein [Gammaproteobacteria bacterium]